MDTLGPIVIQVVCPLYSSSLRGSKCNIDRGDKIWGFSFVHCGDLIQCLFIGGSSLRGCTVLLLDLIIPVLVLVFRNSIKSCVLQGNEHNMHEWLSVLPT